MKEKVLFICKNNSARSQMAEGLLKHFYGEYYEVYSAGSLPTEVNPVAIEVMGEIGIDISVNESKSLEKFQGMNFGHVVTLCDEGSCPVFLGGKNFIHHGFKDPNAFNGSKDDKIALFRRVRDEIKVWIKTEFNRGK